MKPSLPLRSIRPLTLVALLTLGWCLVHAHGEASPAPAAPSPSPAETAEPPLWLGDPDVDPKQAEAAFRQKMTAILREQADFNRAAYDRAGTRDPRWDDDARACIAMTSTPPFADAARSHAEFETQKAAGQRALDHGCTDPFLLDLDVRLNLFHPGAKDDNLARVYTDLETMWWDSDYPPLRKFGGAAMAVKTTVARRLAPDNTIGQQNPGYSLPARSWPRGTDIKTAFQHGRDQLEKLALHPDVSPLLFMQTVEDFYRAASSDPIGRAEVLVPLEKFFEGEEARAHPSHALKLMEGRFWIDYAWDARGGGLAGTVTEDGWKAFGERLEKASAALEEAWKLEPSDPYPARYMIVVCMGAGAERDEMERWFRRAMDAYPNEYAAGFAKMLFLEPKWGGSWKEVLNFGRECYATRAWSTRMAMLLLSAHIRIARSDSEATDYWQQPDVWADVHKLYTGYLAYNPASVYDRTSYALYAADAQQWKIAHEQFEIVGDQPNEEMLQLDHVFKERYRELRKKAAAHANDPAPDATPASSPP